MDPFSIPGLLSLSRPGGPAGLVVVNTFAIQGEQGTGFEKAGTLGEFECGNCRYFDSSAGACNQEDMKCLSKQPRLSDGRVMVGAEDCCEYILRIAKPESKYLEKYNGESTDK